MNPRPPSYCRADSQSRPRPIQANTSSRCRSSHRLDCLTARLPWGRRRGSCARRAARLGVSDVRADTGRLAQARSEARQAASGSRRLRTVGRVRGKHHRIARRIQDRDGDLRDAADIRSADDARRARSSAAPTAAQATALRHIALRRAMLANQPARPPRDRSDSGQGRASWDRWIPDLDCLRASAPHQRARFIHDTLC
jgi:hypothetical protein